MFKNHINKYLPNIQQFIKFGFVGLSNTIISYVIYAVLVYFGLNYIVCNVISCIVSVLNSFYWNNKYVFKEDKEVRSPLKTLAKTFMAYGFTGLILSNVLLLIWVDVLNISKYIAPIINLIFTVPVNYIMNKIWAFKDKRV